MSFSTDMDKAIANMATARKVAVKSAFTTLDTALTDEELDYETRNPEKIATRDRLLKLARELAVRMQ
jgi:hypothetical protein